MSAGPQRPSERATKARRGPDALGRISRRAPVEGAKSWQESLPDAPFETMDIDVITPTNGKAKITYLP
jgi:hypothetical protein